MAAENNEGANLDTASQDEVLNHVLEHTAKAMKAKSHLAFKGKKIKGKRLGAATSQEVISGEAGEAIERDLTKLQPCSSLFRNF